jgi:hypothetical protein
MIRAWTTGTSHEDGAFEKARAQARLQIEALRGQAVRTVVRHAADAQDCHRLLSMLGLDDDTVATVKRPETTANTWLLEHGLAGYIEAVAAAVGVPVEATGFEISDTVTAYLGLAQGWSKRPGRDLMLVWDERQGWLIAVETNPAERPVVVAHLGGVDIIPLPRVVARFVSDVLGGCHPRQLWPADPATTSRDVLTARLSRYALH